MQSSQQRKNSGIMVLDSVDETEDEEDIKTKNLAKYLGMKDGVSASISGQVILLYLETYCLLPWWIISATYWYCITLIYVVTFWQGKLSDGFQSKTSLERKDSGKTDGDEKSKTFFFQK